MWRNLILATCLAVASPAAAQDTTLADIRQQLAALYSDIQGLKTELSTTGALTQGAQGNTPLDRLNNIESELQRLTSKTEELEFRVNRITVDGTNRIGDLEFRICEMEESCDISLLGDTPSLGGVDSAAQVPTADPAPDSDDEPSLAVGEQNDFTRAQEALADGDFRRAADVLTAFSQSYPGSPLGPEASFMRGEALEALGDTSEAARAYLESFGADAQGPFAARALTRLGASLGAIGQTADACITLAEVEVRFPGNPAVADAQAAMSDLGCS
ncbi:MAG: tol-pal system protein YbgF [Paracoccaceae bacterium]